jgi:hypothetical protein
MPAGPQTEGLIDSLVKLVNLRGVEWLSHALCQPACLVGDRLVKLLEAGPRQSE